VLVIISNGLRYDFATIFYDFDCAIAAERTAAATSNERASEQANKQQQMLCISI